MRNYLTLSVLLISSIFCTTTFADAERFKIIVDAGSTGSRLHVFQYNSSPSLPEIKDILSVNVKPGLSSFADHPEEAGNSLKKLLDDATQALQKSGVDLKTIKIDILATAGMRLLPEDKQRAIYANISSYIKNNYEFSAGNIETISGKMESLYSWLDINYLLGNFQNSQPTVGTIDMGGASTQIAFATNDASKPDDEIQIDLNNKHYIVFSKSFLGFGQDQIRERMINNQAAENCYPRNYSFDKARTGTFNLTSCGAIFASLIQEQKLEQKVISIQDQPFIAYSGIYYTYNFFNSDNTPDQTSFESNMQSVCNQTWEQLQKNYPTVPEKYLAVYCANGIYDDQLIYNTYKIKGYQLTVTNQINKKEIDWTLGALLYSLNKKG